MRADLLSYTNCECLCDRIFIVCFMSRDTQLMQSDVDDSKYRSTCIQKQSCFDGGASNLQITTVKQQFESN